MSALLELSKRCEEANGADRELDVAIGFALGRIRERDGNYLYMAGNEADCVVESEYGESRELDHFTSSLDAAITLVPVGMIYMVTNTSITDPVANVGRATALVGEPSDTADREPSEAATSALAICAATFLALAARETAST